MTGRYKWGLTLKQAGWKEPHGSTRRKLNPKKETERRVRLVMKMFTD